MDHDAIKAELGALGWSYSTLEVWLRAEHRCEYCGYDLLASDVTYFFESNVDHVVPGAGEDLNNLALACRTCNFIKRSHDFSAAGEIADRDVIMDRARSAIERQRELNRERRAHAARLLQALTTHRESAAPHAEDGR